MMNRFPNDRVNNFSDAIFAIAITLLVLDIKIPSTMDVESLGTLEVEFFNPEPTMRVPKDLISAQENFERLIENIKQQGLSESDFPFISPYQLDDCAWLANRWTEVLSLPLIQKQRLLALESPLIRLELINDILNQ